MARKNVKRKLSDKSSKKHDEHPREVPEDDDLIHEEEVSKQNQIK